VRAWKLTGDRSLDWLPERPEVLGEAISLVEVRELRTVCVEEATARLTGFVGECVFRWEGAEAEGRQALATLARFAGICGTGAKTGRGFGRTEPVEPVLERQA
jgi:CRISPR/Cas system endoribonuclease Cas6 (RAMP superfamily)